ncbi:MAG: hypothetical protein CME40_00910 [Haliea sp.]|nr:hypothetical protein [Haliea sp.]MAL93633.1 hypothetical protein [Haliea sp.]|tara:strand:+ start:1289 stop:1975 length:687 start_codon:yes stop_codon:yes gene_type:complete
MSDAARFDIGQVVEQAKSVITNPVGYFQTMPKSGGYANPVIFVAVMGAIMGLVSAVISLFGSPVGMLAAGLGAIIIMPIFAVIGAFIGAAILFVIWKLMGSEENYETAFRCQASIAAIYPITALLAIVPYLGTIIAIAWGAFLLIEASVSVHGRPRRTAQIVFGILAVLMIFSNIASERAARQMEARWAEAGKEFEGIEDMSPEEAGRKMGEFLKGLEEAQKGSQSQN